MTAYPELLPASSPRDTNSPRENTERHRPLRRSAPLPANDAAGLLAGARFKGGSNPTKGRGCPPPERKEAAFVSSRKLVPHETIADHRAMLTHGFVHQPYQDEVTRKTIRRVNDVGQAHFVDTSLELAPLGARKPMKGIGANHPNEWLTTTARVLCVGSSNDGATRPHSALPSWAVTMRQASQAKAAERSLERPRTAPPTASRVQYQACAAGHADVIQYRYSGGICPKEYKLEGGRVSSPVVRSVDATTSKSAFWDSRQAYSLNRVRSNLSFLG